MSVMERKTMNKEVGITFDMTATQALELAEGIEYVAGVLRDDMGATQAVEDESYRVLYGSLSLITHAARTLSEFVGEIAVQKGGCHE